jgi:kumamolisin
VRRAASQRASGSGAGGWRPQYRPVPGSEIEPLARAYIVGRPNPLRRIEVTLLLRPRSQPAGGRPASLDDLGAQLPQERRHLTREALASAYGADPADVLKVARFARRHGLRAVGRNLAARTVHLAGTVANFSRAFRVVLFIYRYPGGFYRGRTGPVHIPMMLDRIVQGVFGLDNRPAAKPHFRRKWQLGGVWSHAHGTSYTPTRVAHLYNFPPGASGAGQCIAIIELGGGYSVRDLSLYFQKLGIALPQVTSVGVNGGANRPTGSPDGPDGEVMLDIEVAGAVAPRAKIVVYFAPNTNQGFLRAVTRAIHDTVNRPSVISISWGGPESSWTQQSLNAFNQAFQAAGLIGVTVCAASGDGGSSDGVPGRTAHVDFPASSPYVLACGGTHLEASGGSISAESVWNDGPLGGAGGGGISDYFALPAWQGKAGVPPSVNPGGRTGRGLPDIAGDADENTGYQVRVDGLDTVIGGTSAVAPLIAGLIALLNEKLGTSVGYLNPLLYGKLGLGGAFHDITKGHNDMAGLVGGYNAGPRWDPCSGWGSPDGSAILAGLQVPKKIPVTHGGSTSPGGSPPAGARTGSVPPAGTRAAGQQPPLKDDEVSIKKEPAPLDEVQKQPPLKDDEVSVKKEPGPPDKEQKPTPGEPGHPLD